MDGIHDMGGMHGFGPIAVDEPEAMGFQADWHGRVFAMSRAVRAVLRFGGDHARAVMERMPPADYLATSYYAKWLHGNLEPMKQLGIISEDEIAGGPLRPLPEGSLRRSPLSPKDANRLIFDGMPPLPENPALAPPRHSAGARVRTLAHLADPLRHNRLPRYARDRVGTIERLIGQTPLADAVAANAPRQDWLYRVTFSARELWGEEAASRDEVVLDLWESYLTGPA